MPDDPNIDFLAVIHSLNSGSSELQSAFDLAIETAVDGVVKIPITVLASANALLALQNRIISGLVEQNQQVVERLEAFATQIDSK